jgi:hypothetical protein
MFCICYPTFPSIVDSMDSKAFSKLLTVFEQWNLRNFRLILERETGIEPATNGLGSRYSTIELLPLHP